jgi:D-alanyl-D-alanine endopeptidase (penicillin-binding protein 7)
MNRRFLPVFAALVLSAAVASAAARAGEAPDPARLKLASANAVVLDARTGKTIYAKGANEVTAIASLTKLMTAIVTLDAGLPLDELIEIDIGDLDVIKGSRSRLSMGTMLPRREMLRLALMSSENRAASSLARHYPGGAPAFVAAMNAKAAALGMTNSRFEDPTGLSPQNVSTAKDLSRLVEASAQYPLIRDYSTTPSHYVELQPTGRVLGFNNSNRLVASSAWDIQVQKTGYIREAGRCLVMLATVASKPMIIVLLDSIGKYTRLGDAERVRHWLETGQSMPAPVVRAGKPAVKSTLRVKARLPKVATGQKPAATKVALSGKSGKQARARRA